MDENRVPTIALDTDVDVQVDHSDSRFLNGNDGGWFCCVPCEWLRSNNSVHKASLSVATLLVTSLLVASPVLFLISAVPASDMPKDCRIQLDDSCLYTGELGNTISNSGHSLLDPVDITGTTNSNNQQQQQCKTTGCMSAAIHLLKSIDRRIDPCKDFYQFACGRWHSIRTTTASISSNTQPAFDLYNMQHMINKHIQILLANSSTSSGTFRKLGIFYKSCVKMKDKPISMKPMYKLLEDLGGYLPSGTLGPINLTELISRLLRINGSPLIDIRLDQDLYDPDKLTVFVDVPRRGSILVSLQQQQPFVRYKPFHYKRDDAKESKAYIYIKESVEEKRLLLMDKLLADFLPTKLETTERAQEAKAILLFATTLNKLYPREKDIVNLLQHSDSYQPYNVSKLQTLFPFLKWSELFANVLSWNTTDTDIIYVMSPGYLSSLTSMVTHFQKRTIHNALLLLYARDRLEELLNVTNRDQEQFCSRLTTGTFSQAVSALYVRQHPVAYLRFLEERVSTLFQQLKETLSNRIKAALWLDTKTKSYALEKLKMLKGEFGIWPMFVNNSFVEQLMNKVQVDSDDFFGNVIHRYKQIRTISTEFYNNNAPYSKTWTFPFIINAYYEPRENAIMIPLALLTHPHFRQDVPSSLMYATVGNILSHELLHGFDLHGARYDASGRLNDWLNAQTRLGLEARVDCVARQYARVFRRQVKFKGHNVDIQFDWNVTRNENMADISALQIAHQTWQRMQQLTINNNRKQQPELLAGISFSARQLFFISAAQMYCSPISPENYIMSVELDSHAPFPERVNGIMMNSPSFSDAFNCPLNTPMNPMKKCSTW